MRVRSKQWVVVFAVTALLSAGPVSFDGPSSWANQAPGGTEGEVNLDFARQPGPGGDNHGSGGGPTDGIRPGADPNDFSVSSPRRPQVSTETVPERRIAFESIRTWLQSLVNRFAGLVRPK